MTAPAEIPDAAVRAALAEHRSLLADRPEPTVLSDEALFRRVLEAALPHLPVARQDLHLLPWRQGRHEPRHMYAQIGAEPSDDDPGGQYREDGRTWLVLFGDGDWHPVTVKAWRVDRHGREVVDLEFWDRSELTTRTSSFVVDRQKIREG